MHVLQLGTSVQFCVEVYCSSTCLGLEEVYSFVHMCTAEACGMVQLTSVQFCAVVYCSVHACASVRNNCTVLCVCVLPKRGVVQLAEDCGVVQLISAQLCAVVYCSCMCFSLEQVYSFVRMYTAQLMHVLQSGTIVHGERYFKRMKKMA